MYSIPFKSIITIKLIITKGISRFFSLSFLSCFVLGGFVRLIQPFCQNIKPKYDAIYGPG